MLNYENYFDIIRDNVILEMGISIGVIGKERTFYVVPTNENIHLPTDLLGFNPVKYDPSHPNIVAALGSACTAIKRRIKQLWKLDK